MKKLILFLFFGMLTAVGMSQTVDLDTIVNKQFALTGFFGTPTTLTDSTWRVTVNFYLDDDYSPSGIQAGFYLMDSKTDLFEVTVVNSTSISTANLDIKRTAATGTAPTLRCYIWEDLDNGLIPVPEVSSTGITSSMQSAAITHNANVGGTGSGGIDSLTQAGTTVRIYSGDSIYTIDLQQSDIGGIWYVAESGNNSNAIEGNINFPLADPWTAVQDSAEVGDVVIVLGGSYDGGGTAGNLFRNGITLVGIGEPEITRGGYTDSGNTNEEYIFKFNEGNDETMTVLGDFIFSATNTIFTGNDGSLGGEVTIECKSMTNVHILDFEAPEVLNIKVKNAVNANGDHIEFSYPAGPGFVNNGVVNLTIENIRQNFGQIIDPAVDNGAGQTMTFNINILKASAQFSVVYGASTEEYYENVYNINIESANDIFGPVFIGNYLTTNTEETIFNLRCASCSQTGVMVTPFYSKVRISNSSFLNRTYSLTLKETGVARYSTIEVFNSTFIAESFDFPLVEYDSVSQCNVFIANSFFKKDQNAVMAFRNGPATGKTIKIVNTAMSSSSGSHANISGEGDIYVGGVYNVDQNTNRDPDINFIEIDDYLNTTVGGGSTTLIDSLPNGNVTIDAKTSSFRLDTLNQFVAVTENSQAYQSLNGNITMTAGAGVLTLNGGASGEIKLQGDSLTTAIPEASAFTDGITGVYVANDAQELRLSSRLLPQFDTVNVSTANDTLDMNFNFDQTVVVDMTSAPATVDFVVENPTKGSTITFVFTGVGSSHTFNFGHTDIQLASKASWTIDTSSAKVYVLRYNIDGGGDWIILRDE
jgi:hypothetical protein